MPGANPYVPDGAGSTTPSASPVADAGQGSAQPMMGPAQTTKPRQMPSGGGSPGMDQMGDAQAEGDDASTAVPSGDDGGSSTRDTT